MDGIVVGRGLASATGSACAPLPYTIVQPTREPANRVIIQAAITRWQGDVTRYASLARHGTVLPDVPARAEFAVDVLKAVDYHLEIGVCCHLLAVTIDNHVLGVMNYTDLSPTETSIGLLAVSPRNVPGSPDQPKYRGVGTAMVAALATLLVQNGYTTIYLHPLDDQARVFWSGRGFVPCGGGSLLCVRGKDRISSLVDGCLTREDNPGDGHIVLCGLPKRVRDKLLAH